MSTTKAMIPLLLLLLLLSPLSTTASTAAYPTIPGTIDTSVSSSQPDNLIPIRNEIYGNGKIFDISHRYTNDMPVWDSKDGLGKFLSLPASMKNGSLANNSEMKLPTHTGTHVDSPGHVFDHYFDSGFDVDTLDLEVLNGPALLVDVPRHSNITAEVMKSLHIPKGVRRVLFRTLNTDRRLMFKREFDRSYVGFTKDGAKWLVDNTDIKLVGIDYLSVAAWSDLIPSHLVFLEGRRTKLGFWYFRAKAKAMASLLLLLLLSPLSTTAASSGAYPTIPGSMDTSFPASQDSELIPIRREVYGDGRIFDITHRYTSDMPFMGSENGLGQFLRLPESMKNGSFANISEMKLITHTGTHVDAPGHYYDHYFDAGFDVDTLDLEVLNGPGLLIDVPRGTNITAEVMKSLHIPKGARRVLFRTENTDRRLMFKNQFDTSFVGFTTDGAKWLVDNTDIKLVGIDYLAVAAWSDLVPAHLVLLESREIIIVEGLKLDDIQPGVYSIHCLPLRLLGAEGSPARCILIK
ncbi:hypothetical protein POTOM_005895 [Populus tomentosa]|uniref:Cyclase family protein n=1 Tax=Populus tomentosa TaxID=118781 RepID=A0A8X8D6X9_POPTO|nr:hypothetical protein POTOM_005895 [Populus tomentosa]